MNSRYWPFAKSVSPLACHRARKKRILRSKRSLTIVGFKVGRLNAISFVLATSMTPTEREKGLLCPLPMLITNSEKDAFILLELSISS